jgi:hypothetical protein
MKLQFDTTAKTIKFEETVNLGELIKELDMLLPNKQWEEYKLEIALINNWINPVLIKESAPCGRPCHPFTEFPIITCRSHGYKSNQYNIEC